MWITLPSGALLNISRCDVIGIKEHKKQNDKGEIEVTEYCVTALCDGNEYALYRSKFQIDCENILRDFEAALDAAYIGKDKNEYGVEVDALYSVDPFDGSGFKVS